MGAKHYKNYYTKIEHDQKAITQTQNIGIVIVEQTMD